jgi:hypothetical protein
VLFEENFVVFTQLTWVLSTFPAIGILPIIGFKSPKK